jgi:hypothetical protein
MHYGTFHLGDDGQDEAVEELRAAMGTTRFEIVAPGETWKG